MNAFIKHYSGNTQTYTFSSNEKDLNLLAKQIKSRLNKNDFLITLPAQDTTHIALLKALDTEGILEMMKGRMAGNDTIANTSVIEALGEKLDGIKTVQLKSVEYFPEHGQNLVALFQQQFTVNSPLRMTLDAEAMQIVLEAIATVGNDATAIKDYLTSFTPTHLKSGYFGDYYFNEERTAEGLGRLIYEFQQ
jgi:ABC-type branched-subunit amino acid transport system substrate-binding protein